MKLKKYVFILLAGAFLNGCAVLHHAQVGEVDSEVVLKGRRFEIKVSEIGFDVQELGDISKSMTRDAKTQQDIGNAQAIIGMFQMGPRTGKPVYSIEYADKVFHLIRKECPKGKISGLTSIRETAEYPVVSGEIVKIIGYCLES